MSCLLVCIGETWHPNSRLAAAHVALEAKISESVRLLESFYFRHYYFATLASGNRTHPFNPDHRTRILIPHPHLYYIAYPGPARPIPPSRPDLSGRRSVEDLTRHWDFDDNHDVAVRRKTARLGLADFDLFIAYSNAYTHQRLPSRYQ